MRFPSRRSVLDAQAGMARHSNPQAGVRTNRERLALVAHRRRQTAPGLGDRRGTTARTAHHPLTSARGTGPSAAPARGVRETGLGALFCEPGFPPGGGCGGEPAWESPAPTQGVPPPCETPRGGGEVGIQRDPAHQGLRVSGDLGVGGSKLATLLTSFDRAAKVETPSERAFHVPKSQVPTLLSNHAIVSAHAHPPARHRRRPR